MTIEMGVDVLLKANTGTVDTPTYTEVGGQRSAKLHEERETVDITVKGDAPARNNEYSFYAWSVTCDGLIVPDDTAYAAIKSAIREGTKLMVQIAEGTKTLTGTVLVISQDFEYPYEEGATFSCELKGSGVLTEA